MQKLTILMIVFFVATSLHVSAQENTREERQDRMETLTDAQKGKLKSILSNYDSQSLTAEDAKAIHEAFREAGLRACPAMADAIRETGFNPEKLRELAPPPDMKGDNKRDDNRSTRLTDHPAQGKTGFALSSSAVKEDGSLMSDFTGDGRGVSMPLEWTKVPAGTKYFALNLWHLPHPSSDPSEVKSYWVIYNIPANVRQLPEDVKGLGIDGYNDKDHTGYDPMKSKGPGVKTYNLTIYALSAKPTFSTKKVQRSDLLKAIKGITLDECTLEYTYERGKE